jgi:hypothetical protein
MEVRGGKMRFVRLSVGLNPVAQGNRRAPASRGVWAFPYGHYEMFFMAHQYRSVLPARLSDEAVSEALAQGCADDGNALAREAEAWIRKQGRAQVKLHNFWHPGPFYTVIDKQGMVTHDWMSGEGHWNLLSVEEFAKAVNRHCGGAGKLGYYYGGRREGLWHVSKDFLEVFIPGKI